MGTMQGGRSGFAIANNNKTTTPLKPRSYQEIKAKEIENHSQSVSY